MPAAPNQTALTDEQRKQRYEDLAHQINREDGLVNYRMTWTLQLNGFLFAALALVAKDLAGPMKLFFEYALPLTGFVASAAGLLGVIAANRQLSYLTALWNETDQPHRPRPFGDPHTFTLGRFPSYAPMLVLSSVWLVLLIFQLTHHSKRPDPPPPPAAVSKPVSAAELKR